MYRRFALRGILFSCLLWLIVGSSTVFAQTLVSSDSSTRGTLTDAAPQAQYNVFADAGDALNIEILSITQGMVVQAFILDPDGNVVEALINADNALAIRTDINIATSGTHTILISSRNGAVGDFILTLAGGNGAALDPCEDYMADIMPIVENVCDALSRNQICYGNNNVTTIPALPNFAAQGDTANVSDLISLELAALDQNAAQWGVAVMNVQANLPDTIPGQNVTIVAFGDVNFTPVNGANFGTMQSFYFSTGVGQSSCAQTPQDGILIETPDDAGIVEMTINETRMQIASTIFLNLDLDAQQMTVSTLEGVVVVEAQGGVQLVPAGTGTTLSTNETGIANGQPNPPIPMDQMGLPLPAQRALDQLDNADDEPTPSPATPNPIGRVTPTAIPSPTDLAGVVLPGTGPCVLSTFEPDVNVNVRSGPGTGYGVVASILPTRTYDVIGRNADSSWYQIESGWVAEFVTRRGGDQCTQEPITFVATATPTPSNTPSGGGIVTPDATPDPNAGIAGDNEYNITIDYTQVRQQHFLFGAISYSRGDRSDGVRYNVINTPHGGFGASSRDIYFNVSCSGTGTQYVVIGLPDGRVVRCSAQTYRVNPAMTSGIIVFTFEDNALPEGLYVEWSVSIGMVD